MINHHQNFQLLVDVGWWMLTNNFSSAWPAEKSVHHLAVLLQQPRRQSQAQIQQRWHAYGDVWPWTNDRVEIWSVKHSETHWTILGTRSTWIPQVDHGRPWSHVAWNLTNRLQEGLHCLASRTLQIRFQRFHGSPWISSLATQTLCLEKTHIENIERSHHVTSIRANVVTSIPNSTRLPEWISSKFNGRTSESLDNRRGYSSQFSAHTLPWMSTIALTRSGRSKANCKPTWVQMTGHLCRQMKTLQFCKNFEFFRRKTVKTQSRAWNQQACRLGEWFRLI